MNEQSGGQVNLALEYACREGRSRHLLFAFLASATYVDGNYVCKVARKIARNWKWHTGLMDGPWHSL